MTKRTFGLGALTMISACVSGGLDATSDASAPDGPVLAPPPLPARDASPDPSDASLLFPDGAKPDASMDGDAGATCPASVPTLAELEKDPGWQPAKAPAPVCTANEILQFEANLKDTNIKTWKDLATGLGMACAGCLVTSSAEKNWGPIVYTAASGGDEGFANFGACFGHVSTEACGRAVQFSEFCLDAACDECPTPNKQDQCVAAAAGTGGVCGPFFTTLQAECTNLAAASKPCGTIADAARTLCGPNADAGT